MDVRAHRPDGLAPSPEQVGPYRLLGELGRGGMGVVYRAEDTRLGRQVALKFLPAELTHDATATKRLLAEARAAATLDHPNVCTVYEVSETETGRPYIALACYEGETLAERLARGPLPTEEAVQIAREVAAGVAAAHARGIVHRDLKPSNVFLTEGGTVKVLDFGIAKVPGVSLTRTGHTAGTVEYGAPEQARGHVDARSDVWALGVVLYEMLTGRRPFAAPYEAAVLYAVLHEDPPPPSAVADVPPALDTVVARCLTKDPDDRYPDAAALGEALARVAEPRRAEAGDEQALWQTLRRSRIGQVALAAAVAVVALAAVWAGQAGGEPVMPTAIHLAILVPTPRPDAPDDWAFAEGLAETLASGVMELAPADQDLWVAPVSEVRDLDVTSAREAGSALGVNLAVTGSLLRERDRLMLVLNLTTADDRPRTLASRTLTVSGAEESRIRGRALLAIAAMLGLDVADDQEARLASGTADPEAQRYFLAGIGYLERNREAKDLDRAIDLFEQAIAEDSAFAAAHARLGEAFLAKYTATLDSMWIGRTRTAAAQAEALDDSDASVHVTLSALAHATGETQLAMHHARRAVRLDSTSLGASLALAAAQEAVSDLEAAEATLRRLVRRHPAAWTGPFELGAFYFRHLRLEEAAVQFEQVVALAPGNYQGHSGLGAARHYAGDAEGARVAYERVLKLRPDALSAIINLGTLLLDAGDARGAVHLYRQALAIDSSNHVYWRNLASAYWDLGARARWTVAMRGALRQAERGLAVNPNAPALLAAAATYRQGTGDAEGARRDARLAVALAPADPGVQFNAGRAFALLGDTDEALDALQAAADGGYSFEDAEDDPALATLASHPRFPPSPSRNPKPPPS